MVDKYQIILHVYGYQQIKQNLILYLYDQLVPYNRII
jgi:hypothetical protein